MFISLCVLQVPTDLCCSGWFWRLWWCAGVSCSSWCPPWRLSPPLPASSLSLWHAHSCGSACGSSWAWADPGHPPPATPFHWTLTHTLPRSARSPPPRSPVKEGTRRHTARARKHPDEETHTEVYKHRGKWKIKMHRCTPAVCETKEKGLYITEAKAREASLCCKIQWYRAISLIKASVGRNFMYKHT